MKKGNFVPLLLTSHGEKQSLYSLIDNRYKTISHHPVLVGKSILGSAYGWLVLTNSNSNLDDCCLWNPESNEKIQLPQLDEARYYTTCVLSKPPTDPDCLIVFKSYCNIQQSICRINDAEFVKVSLEDSIVAISSFQGEIYGIFKRGTYYELVTIHLVGKTVEFKSLLMINSGKSHWVVPQVCRRSWVWSYDNYLIESPGGAGDFFFVVQLISKISVYPYSGVEFKVFRLNVNGGLVCLEEVENLDGHTIFIGAYGDGFCCSTSNDGMQGIKPNLIYYTDMSGRIVSVYDLDDRSTTPLLPCPAAGRFKSVNYWVDLPDILCLV
ncbi:hypothetical protein CASFOL_001063 [Castilleja foliolosa]|uniref:KIB1-4 beta-propeller domain-containing protein n=1 Tax=Castilleja foliolosa TaxID=1961234 RepID=A0ABD3ELI1_9LAMI